MTMNQILPGVFRYGDNIYTKNASPGTQVYGEPLIERGEVEYRRWVASRSKLGAAVQNGAELGIKVESEVVYLGAASGTTVSHVSDIAVDGFVIAVEFSKDVARDLLGVAESRDNIAPVVADARNPDEYSDLVDGADVLVQDVSQRDQVEIFERNVEQIPVSGTGLLVVKAGSIDSSADPEAVFSGVEDAISLSVENKIDLSPFYTDQRLFILDI
nr:MAG: fibrillarin-like rRNA methylase [Candidatus Nanosalinarum sp. J07AB56]